MERAAGELTELLHPFEPIAAADLLYLYTSVGERLEPMRSPDLASRRAALMRAVEHASVADSGPLAVDLIGSWSADSEPSRTGYALVMLLAAAVVVVAGDPSAAGRVRSSEGFDFAAAFDTPAGPTPQRLAVTASHLAAALQPDMQPVDVVREVMRCWSDAEYAISALVDAPLDLDALAEIAETFPSCVPSTTRGAVLLASLMLDRLADVTPSLQATATRLAQCIAVERDVAARHSQAALLCPGVPHYPELSGSPAAVEGFLVELFANQVRYVTERSGVSFDRVCRQVWVQVVDDLAERLSAGVAAGAVPWEAFAAEVEASLRCWMSACLHREL